jgi:hypothetical protein
MSSTVKTVVNFFMILFLGLVIGLALFWAFSKTDFYEKMRRGQMPEITEALIVQDALPVLYVVDPDVGPMLLPNTKIHYRTPFFDKKVVTNNDGFTGRDYPLVTDNYRIAILGDSFVESYGVDDTNRFPHVTERLVFEKTDGKLKVEMMGFGVSGWGTAHAYGAIRKYVLKYSPDEIWLAFLPSNDFGDNTPFMNPPPLGPTMIYKGPNSDEIIDIKFGYPDIPAALIAERNRRYGADLLHDTWLNWGYGLLPYYWSTDTNAQWDLIEDHTMQSLRLIKELCDKQNIKVSLVYRITGYDSNQANFDALKNSASEHLGHEVAMERHIAIPRFKNKLAKMGIDFINTHDMPQPGIMTKAEETDVPKHYRTAEFFANLIIEKLEPEMILQD